MKAFAQGLPRPQRNRTSCLETHALSFPANSTKKEKVGASTKLNKVGRMARKRPKSKVLVGTLHYGSCVFPSFSEQKTHFSKFEPCESGESLLKLHETRPKTVM